MLKTMRRITKPIMWFVAIVFVAFLGWQGVFTSGSGRGTVATINGQDISIQTYQAFYDRSYKLFQQELGDTVEFDEFTNRQIRERTWEDIIAKALLSQEAHRRGIVVTNKEVFEYLRRFPPTEVLEMDALMTDGKFDYNKYAQALLDPRVDWAPVENYVRERLLVAKLQMMITSLVRVAESDVKEKWVKDNTELETRFIRFPGERYLGQIQPSQAELQDFYQNNKELFTKQERANLYYVEFPKGPQLADDQKAQKRLQEIRGEIKSDSDFVALAKKYSEDKATRESGGDLGWIEEGSFIPALDQVLKQMQPGQLSESVQSNYGWHLVKLWEKKTSGGKQQFRVSHILLVPKPDPKGLEELKKKATQFASEARSGDFEKVVKKYNLVLGETGWFVRGGYIQGFGDNEQVHEFAFNSKPGAVSGIIETSSSFYILRLKEHRLAGPADFEEVSEDILIQYKKGKALDKALEEAKLVYQSIQKGESLAQAAKAFNQSVVGTGKFKASDGLVPNLGKSPEFIDMALGLSSNNKINPPFRTPLGAFIVELISKQTAPDSLYKIVSDSLYREALQGKQNEVYFQWFSQLRSKAEIKDYREEFFKEETAPEG